MTTVQIACPTCQARIRAPEAAVGRTIRCPQCRNPFTAEDSAGPGRPGRAPAESPANAFAFDDPGPLAAAAASPPAGAFALDSVSGPVEVVPPPALTAPAPAPPREPGPGMLDYLAFRRLVAPSVLVGLHYLGVAGLLLAGLLAAFSLVATAAVAGFDGPVAVIMLVVWLTGAFLGTLAALVFWRVACEVLLVFFRMHELLAEVRANTAPPAD